MQYSYQIDIYFEVENDLVKLQGSLTNVINYINVLISAANIVYEKETGIHLGIDDVELTTRYVLKVLTAKHS